MRFLGPYRELRDAVDPLAAMRQLSDEEIIQALAAAPRREDPYLVNVLATEAMNRTRRASTINRALGEGVVALDRAGRVTFLNPAGETLLGYDPPDLRHRIFHEAVHAGDAEGRPIAAEQCAIRRALDRAETIHSEIETFVRADGTRFPADVTVAPVLREGDVEGAILVFRDVTERRRAERALRNRLAFEETLAAISARFIDPDNLDEAIHGALADLGQTGEASRAYVFQIRPDGKLMDNTHEWCAPGVTPERENLQGLPVDVYQWSTEKLRRGEPVIVEDVSKLPDEAAAEREILQAQNIRALVLVPLYQGGTYKGFLGFDDVAGHGTWSGADVGLLEITSGILGTALQRHRTLGELRLREFCLNNAGESIFLIRRDGRIEEVNRAACEQLGYSREELTSMTVHQVAADPGALDWDAHWRRVRDSGPATMEALHRRADGTILPVELRMNHLEFEGRTYHVAFARDITERKRAENRLRESEERYRSLFEHNPDAVFSLDLAGRLASVNPACEAISGYPPDELLGARFDPFVVPDDRREAQDGLRRATAGEAQRLRLAIRHKDGHRVPLAITAVPVRVKKRITGVHVIASPWRDGE